MIGRLDQIVTISRMSRVPDGAGGYREAVAPLIDDPQPWAAVEEKGAREVERDGRKILSHVAEFTMRAREDLRGADRIAWRDRVYQIDGIVRRVARGRYVVVTGSTGGAE